MRWTIFDNYILGYHKKKLTFSPTTKVAAFDLDSTLIFPTSGGIHSKGEDDWRLYDPSVPKKLQSYIDLGYKIVIYTNQSGLGNNKPRVSKETWMNKIQKVAKIIKVPFMILVSIKKDNFRKPKIKLWLNYIKCDKKNEFFCGDAGGLPKRIILGRDIKKDFSDSDLKFAINLGIRFIHRDEFIFGVQSEIQINYPINFDTILKGKYKEFIPLSKTIKN